jgi:hypothetical protein
MTKTRIVATAALVASGLALGSAQAAGHMGGSGGGGGHGGSWSGGHGGWSGGGHGGGGYHGGGYHGGGYYHGGYYHGHGYYPYYATAVGFYFGAPWVWGPWYWGGYPYDYYYQGYAYPTYPADPGPGAYPEGTIQTPPTTQVDPNAPGAPTQAPAYMNYCVSAKAYFPKVTTCPEGWKFVPAQ